MLTGKHRSSIAITAAILLTGVGVAIATAVTAPAPTPGSPSTTATTTADPRAAELEKSVSDLLAQVGPLEAAVAASEIPVAPLVPSRDAGPGTSSVSQPTGTPYESDDDYAAPTGESYEDHGEYADESEGEDEDAAKYEHEDEDDDEDADEDRDDD